MRIWLVVLSLLLSSTAAAKDFAALHREAQRAYHAHQDAKALRIWKRLSRRQYPPAIAAMGWLYWRGHIVKRDVGQARIWLRRAALMGHVWSMMTLSLTLTESEVLPRDYRRGLMWLWVARSKKACRANKLCRRETALRIETIKRRMHRREINGALRYFANFRRTGKEPPRLNYEY